MNKPEWKQKLDDVVNYGLTAAKKNPGASTVFNGKHWVPLERVLPEMQTLCTSADKMASALSAIRDYLTPRYQDSELYMIAIEALDKYESGR